MNLALKIENTCVVKLSSNSVVLFLKNKRENKMDVSILFKNIVVANHVCIKVSVNQWYEQVKNVKTCVDLQWREIKSSLPLRFNYSAL